MLTSKKYLPIFAAFVIGAMAAAAYAVHAQTVATASPQTSPASAVGVSHDTGDGDGETTDDNGQIQSDAQDPQHVDGETNDDAKNAVSTSTQEVENGPGDTGPDAGEND